MINIFKTNMIMFVSPLLTTTLSTFGVSFSIDIILDVAFSTPLFPLFQLLFLLTPFFQKFLLFLTPVAFNAFSFFLLIVVFYTSFNATIVLFAHDIFFSFLSINVLSTLNASISFFLIVVVISILDTSFLSHNYFCWSFL